MSEERIVLTKEQAKAMLPEGEVVHTFRGRAMMLIGVDWGRAEIIEAIEKYPVELSGPMATGMGHGMCLEDERGWLFIATKEPENEPQP